VFQGLSAVGLLAVGNRQLGFKLQSSNVIEKRNKTADSYIFIQDMKMQYLV